VTEWAAVAERAEERGKMEEADDSGRAERVGVSKCFPPELCEDLREITNDPFRGSSNQCAFLSTNPTDSSECPVSSSSGRVTRNSHFPKDCSAIPVILELKSFHLKEGVEKNECPLFQSLCHS
jgi:hypothetical protein